MKSIRKCQFLVENHKKVTRSQSGIFMQQVLFTQPIQVSAILVCIQTFRTFFLQIILCAFALVHVTALTKLTLIFWLNSCHTVWSESKKIYSRGSLAQNDFIIIMKQFLVFSSQNYFIATNSNRSCVIIFVIGCDVAGIFFNDSDFSSLVCLGKQAFKFKIVCTSEYAELLSYEPALILTVFSNETIKFKIHKYVI